MYFSVVAIAKVQEWTHTRRLDLQIDPVKLNSQNQQLASWVATEELTHLKDSVSQLPNPIPREGDRQTVD